MLAGDDDPVERDTVTAAQIDHQLTQRRRDLFNLRPLVQRRRAQLNGLAAAVEQFDPDMVFDLLDAPGKGRLRQVPPFGRRAERPGLRDCEDIL